MRHIDRALNRVTMYRLVVTIIAAYIVFGVVAAFAGRLSFTPNELITSVLIVIIAAFATDRLFARLFKVPTNLESWLITALILVVVLQPADSIASGLALVLAGAISSASKFILAYRGRHIFNPAALAAAVVALTALQPSTWWIGNSVFWPLTLIAGLAVVRKIRRFPLVIGFIAVAILMQAFIFLVQGQPLLDGLKGALLSSPLIFLATIMLTEPATMPPRCDQQIIFATLVAVLYVTGWTVGPIIMYPEVALLAGNLYAFAVMPKFRARLKLVNIQKISDKVYNYVFRPDRPFIFYPGQYMEWTMAGVPYDSRGNRRTFTLASSPTEPTVQLGIKYYDSPSAYKTAFMHLRPGDTVDVGQLAGDFTLPPGNAPLALIAGGIGITPFRSMAKYLIDTGKKRDITLLYFVPDASELAYADVFEAAAAVGVRFIPITTRSNTPDKRILQAKLSPELLRRFIPDYTERLFYVSGPSAMVDDTKRFLRGLQVPRRHIRTDHFSGY